MTEAKEIGIKAFADVSDAEENLNNLINTINEISGFNIDATINVDDTALEGAKTSATDLSEDLSNAAGSAGDLTASICDIDSLPLENADQAAQNLAEDLSNAAGSANEVSGAMSETAESGGALGAVAGGAAALGMGAFFNEAVTGAGKFSDSWERIRLTMGETGKSIDDVKAAWQPAISEMVSITGRGAGDVRNFISMMGVAGVKSADVIKDSFSAVAGAAYVTGMPLESVENAFKRVVSTGTLGTRQLMALGLNSQDVYNATGMTVADLTEKMKGMTTEQRAALIAGIMNAKYGSAANEAYKNSWQHVVDMIGRAWDMLTRVFGALMIPIIIPILDKVSGLVMDFAKSVEGLSGPWKTVAGVLVVAVAGFVMIAGAAGVLGAVLNALNFQIYTSAARWIWETGVKAVSTAATYARAAAEWVLNTATGGGIIATITSTGARILHTAATIAGTIATGAATAAQWLLNAAMSANPIAIVVLAIVALVAALWWLYNNNETVRNAINGLWGILKGIGNFIVGVFINAWKVLSDAWNNLGGIVRMLLPIFFPFLWIFMNINNIIPMVIGTLQQLPGAFGSVFGAISGVITGIIPSIVGGLGDLWNNIINFYTKTLPGWIGEGAKYIGDFFWNTIGKPIADLPGKIGEWLKGVWDAFVKWFQDLGKGLYKFFADAWRGAIDAIKNVAPDWLDPALDYIRGFFPASPPKFGPLADITPEGMGAWVSSLLAGFGKGFTSIPTSAFALPTGVVNNITKTGGGGGKVEINVNIDKLPAGMTEDQAYRFGKRIGEGVNDADVVRQARTKGFNI